MTNLFKILPILAIVVGIGGAWVSQADENQCETIGTTGYDTPPNPLQPLEHPDNNTITVLGKFNEDFSCQTSNNQCHWVYDPDSPSATPGGWVQCMGDFEEL